MFSALPEQREAGESSGAGKQQQQFIVTAVPGPGAADILLVGGGGGGGYKGGGGGGGQVVTAPVTLTAQTYIVKVGTGGHGDMPTSSPTGTEAHSQTWRINNVRTTISEIPHSEQVAEEKVDLTAPRMTLTRAVHQDIEMDLVACCGWRRLCVQFKWWF